MLLLGIAVGIAHNSLLGQLGAAAAVEMQFLCLCLLMFLCSSPLDNG